MKNKNKYKYMGMLLIAVSLIFLTIHAVLKLISSNWMDWQHWFVLIIAVVTIPTGLYLSSKRRN